MKTTLLKISLLSLLALAIACAASVLGAEGNATVERVLFKSGKVMTVQGGATTEATNDFALTGDIAVMTNGTFAVLKGKARPFREGDDLGADGLLTRTDGSIGPVLNHLVMKSGRAVLVIDGAAAPLTRDYALGDGTRIQPDATVVAPNGVRSRMQDGQLYKLDGSSLPSNDSITLQRGKVVLQKDGSRMTVAPGQSVMMSDGTKVFGDGSLVTPDGKRETLKEGEIRRVEGVSVRGK